MPEKMLEGLVVGLDHVGVCVESLDGAEGLWSELCGLPIAHRERVVPQKAEVAFVDSPSGGASLELVAPLEGNEGLVKFLAKRGEGLHHVAIAVTDIDAALVRLKAAGVPLIDQVARLGARGHRVAFLHPKGTRGTLVELVQRHVR